VESTFGSKSLVEQGTKLIAALAVSVIVGIGRSRFGSGTGGEAGLRNPRWEHQRPTWSAINLQVGLPMDLQATPDVSLHQMVQAIVTVLAVINPVVCGSILLTLTPKLAPAQRRRKAVSVVLSILLILVASALIGLKILSIFNISLDVFRIVGGMIIAYMGFDMLSGRQTVGRATPTDDDTAASNSLAPLIMFAAGPGTITAVVTLAAVHTPDGLPVTAIVAAVVGAGVTFAVLLLAIGMGSRLGHSTQAMITRSMGLIVASMGMQFVLTGLKDFLSL
jgi:multiple antibiotic resistance protein